MSLENRMIQYLKVQGCAFSTIKTYVGVLRVIEKKHSAFEFYNSQQLVSLMNDVQDPITRGNYRNVILKAHRDMLGKKINIPFIKKPERLQGIYSFDEVKLIFSKITNVKHSAIARLLYTEGFRVSEVVGVLKADCNKADKSICIRETKNKKDYKKYLDDSTILALEKYCVWLKQTNIRLNKYLFEGVDGCQYSKRSIQQFMRDAIKKTNLPVKGSCHVFRRSSSVWKLETGWDMKYIAASLNNSVKTCEKYYTQVRPDYLKTLIKPSL